MNRRDKILRAVIFLAGIICMYLFLAVRVKPMFNLVLKEKVMEGYWENVKYGELYYFNFIKYFREDLPPYSPERKYRFTDRHPGIQQADILAFGDSFFDFSRMTTFPEALGNRLNKKVHYERSDLPLRYLKEHHYVNDRPRVLIYESAEYYIPIKFKEYHKDDYMPDNRSPLRKAAAGIRDFIFYSNSENNYNVLLTRSYFTTGIYSFISTFKFNTLGYISRVTPEYSLDGKTPWLFYHEHISAPVMGFDYQHSDEEIDEYCNRIADLAKQLKELYDIQMVFLPIPSKYTICHNIVNHKEYSNFLPRIQDGLKKRGVPVIDLYSDFKNSKEVLYFGTDTHWNPKGQEIALENTIEVMDTILNLKNIPVSLNETAQNTKRHE